jgi:hypothetical protein
VGPHRISRPLRVPLAQRAHQFLVLPFDVAPVISRDISDSSFSINATRRSLPAAPAISEWNLALRWSVATIDAVPDSLATNRGHIRSISLIYRSRQRVGVIALAN